MKHPTSAPDRRSCRRAPSGITCAIVTTIASLVATPRTALARGECFGFEGDCYIPGGCDDSACCNMICSIDPFCCRAAWDQICADEAIRLCLPLCTGPRCDGAIPENEACGEQINGGCDFPPSSASNCCYSHPAPGCDDAACVASVCEIAPFCCSLEWYDECAAYAAFLCPKPCTDVPYTFSEIQCGQTVCGTIWGQAGLPQDIDWYRFTVADNGTEVTFTLDPSFPASFSLFDASSCIDPPELAVDDVLECVNTITACLNAGTYAVRVSAVVPATSCFDAAYSLGMSCLVKGCLVDAGCDSLGPPLTLIATDADEGDHLGYDVAISGDTLLVSALSDEVSGLNFAGSVYVFVRNGEFWTQQAKLVASDPGQGADFGESVALDGDTALIGAFVDDHSGFANAGSVYVFVRKGTVWTQQAKLIAPNPANDDRFGSSVALDGDRALIGAEYRDHSGKIDAGMAYVFVRSGETWTLQATLVASDAAAGDYFGSSVALEGNTALIGAPFDDHPAVDAGSVYCFGYAAGAWSEQAHLVPVDSGMEDYFGSSVALRGDTAVVGASGDSTQPHSHYAGAAYFFVRSAGTWTQQDKVLNPTPDWFDYFGHSVDLDGDTAVIGSQTGSYVYTRDGMTWTQVTGVLQGRSVAVAGNVGAVGASGADLPGIPNAGIAYVFNRLLMPGDVNCDDVVNFDDLLAVINAWGPCASPCPADIAPPPQGDGIVGIDDLLLVINDWS